MAPYAYRCDGLGKRAGAANLNDMIYAASREVSHPLPPVRDVAIVDHMVGAEGADTFQLLVRRRGGDNHRTRHFRDLQRGDGNTAGAQHQDGVAGLDLPIADQRPPGGDASPRSGISAWHPGEPCQASIAAASLNFTIKQESALNPPTSDRTLPRVTTLPPDAPKVGPAADEYSGMRLAFFALANAIK